MRGAKPHIIDEWQDAPAVWNVVRHRIDDEANTPQRRARYYRAYSVSMGMYGLVTHNVREFGRVQGRASLSASSRGNAGALSQLSLSQPEREGTYRIVTVCFDEAGNVIEPAGVCSDYDTGSPFPTFAIIKPAVDNTRVDMSPYGQSIFADAVDAIQAVDLAFDALINEVDVSKMRIFLSDVMFDDSIIADTAASNASDMAEVGVTMHAWEYRAKWYGEDEQTARERAKGLGAVPSPLVAARAGSGAVAAE